MSVCDYEAMVSGSDPRDKFVLMLLERIDKLEGEHATMMTAMETLLKRLERSDAHLVKVLRRKIIDDYRHHYGNDTSTHIAENNYYLKALLCSLEHWATNTPEFQLVEHAKSGTESLIAMSEYVIGIVEGNQDVIVGVGKYFSCMSIAHLENFMTWDTMPDLV